MLIPASPLRLIDLAALTYVGVKRSSNGISTLVTAAANVSGLIIRHAIVFSYSTANIGTLVVDTAAPSAEHVRSIVGTGSNQNSSLHFPVLVRPGDGIFATQIGTGNCGFSVWYELL